MDINNRLNNHELPGLTSPFDPQIYECPHHAMIQEILINWVTENAKTRVNGGALKTKFYNGNERDLRAHGLLFDWIVLTIKDAVDQFSRFTNSAYNESAEETKVFKIADYWGMMYDVGGGTVLHNHFPYSLSFGYYLCTPDGSSPLIIEGKEIQVTEGRLIIFGGHQSHEVPDSDISGRCMIAGNIANTGAIE